MESKALSLSEAVRLWNEVGAPYEAALARMCVAEAHRARGSEHRAVLESRAARARHDAYRRRLAEIEDA